VAHEKPPACNAFLKKEVHFSSSTKGRGAYEEDTEETRKGTRMIRGKKQGIADILKRLRILA